MSRPPVEEPITKTVQFGGGEETESSHPAFGQISLHKIQGNQVLYGSDFVHHSTVRIAIHESIFRRGLSHDWYFPKGQLIEVELSEAQWANFVSSFNLGSGVPCTLKFVANDEVPEKPSLPDPDLRREYSKELEDTLKDSIAELKKLESRIDELSSKLPKKTHEELRGYVRMAMQEIRSNAPFVKKQFDKHVEDSIEKAKVEVNAYATNTIMRAGLEAIQDQKIKLLEIANDKE